MRDKHIKNPHVKVQVSHGIKPEKESKISISFQYLTTNKEFNFQSFKKELRAKSQAFEQLVEFLKGLTSRTMLDIINHRKEQSYGFELLEINQIKFSPDDYTLGEDAKLYVFRYGNNGNGGNYRLLGFFEHNQTVLNIIGFDFNYSAYDHG